MTDSGELNDRQRRAVAWIVGGMSGPEAFRKAGFSPSYSRKAAKVLRQPLYVAAIEAERAVLREQLPYSVASAVNEIDQQIKGALTAKSPNYMAAAKLLDLKCRIYGLIKEKIEIATIDLTGALQRAEGRVLASTMANGASISVEPLPSPSTKAIRWAPHVAGDPAPENPDAGSADAESDCQVKKVGPKNQ